MSKFNYEPPAIHQKMQWSYHQSVPNNLLQNDIGEDVSIALKYKKKNVDLIDGNRRNEIVTYVIDNKRAFNYVREPKRYIPYNVSKDAYDLFFYNYGFKQY